MGRPLQWSMFELARPVNFGVDAGEFLQFPGTGTGYPLDHMRSHVSA